jgi:hypothetical protein
VAGLGTQRVRDLSEIFMALSEDQLKGFEAVSNNIYHSNYSL